MTLPGDVSGMMMHSRYGQLSPKKPNYELSPGVCILRPIEDTETTTATKKTLAVGLPKYYVKVMAACFVWREFASIAANHRNVH